MANEKRLIDANALYAEIERVYVDHYEQSSYKFIHDFFNAVRRRIRRAPTVSAVEVVRCGECRFVDTDACPMSGTPGRVSASDFCSYGERRTE